jgi:hypothetical protein
MDVDEGIRALCARGFLFHAVRDEDEAIAARAVPSRRHGADDVVWTYEDGAVPTIQALLDLPDPDEPGAPHRARRAPSGLWLPPSAIRV